LEHFSVAELIGFYVEKYPHSNAIIALKAINYFDEIDENIDPPKLLKPLSIEKITNRINSAILNPNKTF
jgi:hypothetical protein